MFSPKPQKNESGQAALETAIILIAFVVVASVFAFAVLSAGTTPPERSGRASSADVPAVQSPVEVKGAVIAQARDGIVANVIFTVSPTAGGEPILLEDVVLGYRDGTGFNNNISFDAAWLQGEGPLLEEYELAEITVDFAGMTYADGSTAISLGADTTFTLEIKPPVGSALQIDRATPTALAAVMDLQ